MNPTAPECGVAPTNALACPVRVRRKPATRAGCSGRRQGSRPDGTGGVARKDAGEEQGSREREKPCRLALGAARARA